VKILVLADAHGARWKVHDLIKNTAPDIIVIPGDLPSSIDFPVLILSFVRGGRRGEYIKQIYQRYSERLTFRQIRTAKRLLLSLEKYDIPVLLIHGNTETKETRDWLRLFCFRYSNFHWLSDRSFSIDDTQFIGHGWVAIDFDHARELSAGEIPERSAKSIILNTIGNSRRNVDRSVLIAHAPPFGTPLDYLPHKRIHAGSRVVRDILDSGLAQSVISGHLHESRGTYQSKKNWWGINAGAIIDNVACTLDLNKKKVIWYTNVVNQFGISPLVYRNRNKYQYDKR
jgi:Icc-related predicted phosphoesterase